MATRNKRKLAALIKENCEEHPKSNLAQNSNVSRSQEDYITQFSEEIEGRVKKKLSQEFSRTETRILGALARLDNFLMKASRKALSTSQGKNEDDSQKDPHPEAGFFHSQMTQISGPEDDHDSSIRKSGSLGSYHILTVEQLNNLKKYCSLLLPMWDENQNFLLIKTYFKIFRKNGK